MLALRRALVTVLVAVLLAGALAGGWSIYIQQTGNLHAVSEDGVYRSNTLGAAQLEQVIDTKGIKTILNLRGGDAADAWYVQERSTAARHGIQYIDIPMSEDIVPDTALLQQLTEALLTAPHPLLIHCKAGADRTGLASALYQYLVEAKSPEQAARQLSFYYGHFPWLWSKTGAMDTAFWQVVATRQDMPR